MEQTFAKWLTPLSSSSSSHKTAAEDRAALEQTIGQAYLDRLNGYPVGNMAEIYKSIGGTDPSAIAVLTTAFGSNFDAIAARGINTVNDSARAGLRTVLQAENLKAPTTGAFRDLLFGTEATTTVGTLRTSVSLTPAAPGGD
jgi:hypothetical protein